MHSEPGYDSFFNQFGSLIGLDRLLSFHLNDSKSALDSRVDRHEEIGDGEIGPDCFAKLVNDERFNKIPMILEIPGDDSRYIDNLSRLRSFID